jgi:hypothetical protein
MWDVRPCGSCKNRRFGGTYQVFLRNVRRLLVTASVVPSSPILVTLIEVLSSSETSFLTRATRRNIPEDDILHSHRCENLESYKPNKQISSQSYTNNEGHEEWCLLRCYAVWLL